MLMKRLVPFLLSNIAFATTPTSPETKVTGCEPTPPPHEELALQEYTDTGFVLLQTDKVITSFEVAVGAPSSDVRPFSGMAPALKKQLLGNAKKLDGLFVPEVLPRLHIINVAGLQGEEFAIKMQSHLEQQLGPYDTYVNVCDVGCGNITVGGRRLESVIPMTDEAFPSGECIYKGPMWPPTPSNWHGKCDGYRRAQMKFPFGLVHEFTRLQALGGPLPRWWFVKDDDTFVRADRLMALTHGFEPETDRVLFSNCMQENCTDNEIHGGAGWLVSKALAEALVVDFGQSWLELTEENIVYGIADGCGSSPYHCWFTFEHSLQLTLQKVPGLTHIYQTNMMFTGSCFPGDPSLVTYHMRDLRKNISDDEALFHVADCFA